MKGYFICPKIIFIYCYTCAAWGIRINLYHSPSPFHQTNRATRCVADAPPIENNPDHGASHPRGSLSQHCDAVEELRLFFFRLEKVVRARPDFFDSFRRSITTMFARCTAPPRPSHTLWPHPRLPEYHGKGSLGDSGASMRFCHAKCCPASLPPPPHHPSEVGSDAVSSAMCLFRRADRLLPRLCIYTKRV